MYGDMRTLIIVEDESEIRNGLVELIPWAEIGFEVTASFENGTQAINWLRRHHVDVVVTDIMMPNGTGLDVAEMLSREQRMEMIVFYSAFQDFRYAQLGIKYGVKRYITKDMGYQELIDVFREAKRDLDLAYHHAAAKVSEELPQESADAVGSLMRYLQKNYRNATLQSAAEVVRMNPSYLSTYIKKHLNENFKAILTRIRMEKAYELLSDPTYRVADVCRMVGYHDDRMFIRCFRQQYGVTPGEFRKRQRREDEA